jgi:hypothetical protein
MKAKQKKKQDPQLPPHRPQTRDLKMPVTSSIKAAAAMLGVDPEEVREAKEAGAPGFKYAMVDLAAFVPWFIAWVRSGGAAPQGELPLGGQRKVSARSQVDEWTAKIKQLDYEERVGLVVKKGDITKGLAAIVPAFFEDLDRVFRNEMPPKLVGLRELEIRAKCAEKVEQFKASLHISFAKLLELTKPDGKEDK